MMKELWHSFPRQLEQKINALLETAEPNRNKAFQLYKACQRDQLWSESFERFSEVLTSYFSIPRSLRSKGGLDSFLERPLDSDLYAEFQLDFRNSYVDGKAVLNIVSWAHNLIRINIKTTSVVISSDVLTKTLHYITNPPLFEKAQDITFDDFCEAWKKVVFKLFGKTYDSEMGKILSELRWLQTQAPQSDKDSSSEAFFPTIYLTQTELDWVLDVQRNIFIREMAPKFPLSRGPEKQRLINLARALQLYQIVQKSQLPEFIQHRENIRTTILYQCENLLKERAR